MNTLTKTLSLLSLREKKRGVTVLFMVIIMAALESAGVASIMPFLAVLGSPEAVDTNPLLSELYKFSHRFGVSNADHFLMVLGTISFATIIVSALYRLSTQYVLNRFIEMCRYTVSSSFMETYLRQPYVYFLSRHSGEMSKAVLSEVDQLVSGVLRPVMLMIAQGVVLIGLVVLLIVTDASLAAAVAGIFGLVYGLIYVAMRRVLRHVGQVRVAANKERFKVVGEAFGCIKSIKILGCEQLYLNRYNRPAQSYAKSQVTKQVLSQLPNYIIEALIFGGILLLTLIMLGQYGGAQKGALGQILPILGLYAFAAYRIKPAAQVLFQGVASLRYGAAAVDNMYEDLHDCRKEQQSLISAAIKPLRALESIELQGIDYIYPNAHKLSLTGIDIAIPVGTSLGLVGSTGAGKTTLVDIVLGLLRPVNGAICVDGQPVTESTLRMWQRSLGYVPQEIILADTSILENIALGVPVDQIDHEQVERCARMAQIHQFINDDLPQQYATSVGERGVRLSGGQRQRIGIARALYHDPDVLVFDEATSALDAVTEKAVMQAIRSLGKHKKTVIIIAHRINTIRECDNIVLLAKGRVKAQGSYEELMKTNKTFSSMVDF